MAGVLGEGQRPVAARGFPDGFNIAEGGVEIGDLPPGPGRVRDRAPGEGVRVPAGDGGIVDLKPAEIVLPVPPVRGGGR